MNAITLTSDLTMSSLEIAELVGKRHDNVRRTVESLLEKNVIQLPQLEEVINHLGQSVTQYRVGKRDSYIIVAQLSPKFTAKLVDRWQELEAQQEKAVAVPDFSNPAEAARAWADQYEAAQKAIATKAEIGSRREATAMNTASQASKKANSLEIQLDRSKEYASVKRMEMLYHGVKFNWRPLKSAGNDMGIESIDIFDANYGTVKAYHKDVWMEAYALSIDPVV